MLSNYMACNFQDSRCSKTLSNSPSRNKSGQLFVQATNLAHQTMGLEGIATSEECGILCFTSKQNHKTNMLKGLTLFPK